MSSVLWRLGNWELGIPWPKSFLFHVHQALFLKVVFWVSAFVKPGILLLVRMGDLTPTCRKGDPFQSPRVGSSLTLRSDLSRGRHVQTYWEGRPGGGQQVRGPGGSLCRGAPRLGFDAVEMSFQVLSGPSS